MKSVSGEQSARWYPETERRESLDRLHASLPYRSGHRLPQPGCVRPAPTPTDRVRQRRAEDHYVGELAAFDAHTHPAGMFIVTEAEAAEIRAVYEQRGELSAALSYADYSPV